MSGLAKLIKDKAPSAIIKKKIEEYNGVKIAIEASPVLCQFMSAMNLSDSSGRVTSHLKGLFDRTVGFLEKGIKPVYVFKTRAEHQNAENSASPNQTSKVTEEQIEEAKTLLALMGVPYIEAQSVKTKCAALVNDGKVYGVATESLDALAFGAKIVIRQLALGSKLMEEFNYAEMLKGFEFNGDQFIDMFILMNGKYCDKIDGIGPIKAYNLIKTHKSIEQFKENSGTKIPENWNYAGARESFKTSENTSTAEFKWTEPNEDGLVKFLCDERNFNKEYVVKRAETIRQALKKTTQGKINFGASSSKRKKDKQETNTKKLKGEPKNVKK